MSAFCINGGFVMDDIIIRNVTADDAERLLEIYAPYVENTAITFEYDVPSLEEFRGRIIHTLEKYPYFAAVRDGEIIGYAYAGAFHPRIAYEHSAETSIYVDVTKKHSGAGRALYEALEAALKRQNILNLYACIAYTERPDEHLDNNSTEFHAHMGYRMIGRFIECGYKFGRWYDMVWMEKMLGEHTDKPAAVVPYPQLKD